MRDCLINWNRPQSGAPQVAQTGRTRTQLEAGTFSETRPRRPPPPTRPRRSSPSPPTVIAHSGARSASKSAALTLRVDSESRTARPSSAASLAPAAQFDDDRVVADVGDEQTRRLQDARRGSARVPEVLRRPRDVLSIIGSNSAEIT